MENLLTSAEFAFTKTKLSVQDQVWFCCCWVILIFETIWKSENG